MSAALSFETITNKSHAAIRPATKLFYNEVYTPLPIMMMVEGYRLYVATKNSELVGAANVGVDVFDDFAYIRKIAVKPAYRNNKIGSELLRYAMDNIRKAGKPKAAICPSNKDNERLYRRLGFDEDPSFDGSPSWLFKALR